MLACPPKASAVSASVQPARVEMEQVSVAEPEEPTNIIKIIDIKTSTRGWGDKEKKDETKQFQLILYKHFFSKQFGVPVDNIDIEFFIVKRKIWEEAEFEAAKRRVQEFIPASGKVKVNKAVKTVDEFIESVFNNDGTYKNVSFSPNPSAHNCRFCPFKENKDLCDKGLL